MIHWLIIFGLLWNPLWAAVHPPNLEELASFMDSSYDAMDDIYETYAGTSPIPKAEIMKKISKTIRSVDYWSSEYARKSNILKLFLSNLMLESQLQDDAELLSDNLRVIDYTYASFQEYARNPDEYTTESALISAATSESRFGIISVIRDIRDLFIPGDNQQRRKNLMIALAQETQVKALNLCDIGNSQERILDLYDVLAVIELKAYLVMSTGNLMRSLRDKNDPMDYNQAIGEEVQTAIQTYMIFYQHAKQIASTQFRTCDPRQHIRGETFHEFERFMQDVYIMEHNLDPSDSCSASCSTAGNPVMNPNCNKGCLKGKSRCFGTMRNCDKHSDVTVCENGGAEPMRYQWVRQYDAPYKYYSQNRQTCRGSPADLRGYTYGFYYCEVCRCVCVEEKHGSTSNRFISLREQVSDIANNKVIVGVKFIMVEKTAHIQIQEAVVGANGTIDEDSATWKKVENIRYDGDQSKSANEAIFFKKNDDGSEEQLGSTDIADLTWDRRTLYLDHLTAPKDYLITGIKFARTFRESVQPIYLQIQATYFNSETGELNPEESQWLGPTDTYYALEERVAYEPLGFDNPLLAYRMTMNTKPNTVVKVDWSSSMNDAGQAVIPFLDGQPVYTHPLNPLTSVGLYIKSQRGYAGFLTFVLEALDTSMAIMRG